MEKTDDTIIASGPVIIENNKVLLNREQKDYGETPWLFPGGKMETEDIDEEACCHREVMEELGIRVKILKKLLTITEEHDSKKYELHHYLAERIGDVNCTNPEIIEWAWHDINNLPDNCMPNVYKIIDYIKKDL